MKKISIILMAAASILAVACSKMDQAPSTTGNTLKAYAPENTKTTIDGLTVKWAAGDALYVYGESSKTVNYKYVLDPASVGSTTGTFNAEGTAIDEAGAVMAFYPYSWSKATGTYSQITIPSSQDESTIGDGVLPLWGKGTLADGLTFQHLGAILRFKLYTTQAGKTLTGVKINNGRFIAVRYYTNSAKTINYASGELNYVVYQCNKTLSTDVSNPTVVDILIAAYGGNTLSDFAISLSCSDGSSFGKTMAGTKAVAAGSIVSFSTLACDFVNDTQIKYDEGDWQDFNGTVGDLSGVGSITIKSLNGHTALSEVALNNIATAIKNADHTINLDISKIEYFSEIWPTVFVGNTHIGDLSLPYNINEFSPYPFNSSSLQKLTIPASLTGSAFGCGNFRYVNNAYFDVASDNPNFKSIDGSIYTKGGKTLVEGSRIKENITIPEGITTIGRHAFFSNIHLKTLVLPSTLLSVEMQTEIKKLEYIDATAITGSVPTWADFHSDMTELHRYPGFYVSAETTKTIKVPAGRENDYREAWAPFFTPTPGSGSYTSWKPWVVTSDGN